MAPMNNTSAMRAVGLLLMVGGFGALALIIWREFYG